jgi:Tol biopolymer transport system component
MIVSAALIVSACAPSSGAPTPVASAAGESSPIAAGSEVVTPSPAPPVATPSEPSLPVFAPDAPLILYYHCWAGCGQAGGQAGNFVMGLDGSNPQRIGADAPGTHKHPDWSPDGKHVVFVDEADGHLWVAHLDGSPTERLAVCETSYCDYPAWSPDGKRIAYSRIEGSLGATGPAALGIEVVDLATMRVTPVVRLERPLLVDVPRWSPDGTELVVGVDRMDEDGFDTGAAIAIVPSTGGALRYLTDFELFGYNPDWDPITGRVVFSVEAVGYSAAPDPEDPWDLYTIRPDGTDLRRLTTAAPGEHLWHPRWTPDGSRITAAIQHTAGVWVDAATGAIERFSTSLPLGRPQVRPLP